MHEAWTTSSTTTPRAFTLRKVFCSAKKPLRAHGRGAAPANFGLAPSVLEDEAVYLRLPHNVGGCDSNLLRQRSKADNCTRRPRRVTVSQPVEFPSAPVTHPIRIAPQAKSRRLTYRHTRGRGGCGPWAGRLCTCLPASQRNSITNSKIIPMRQDQHEGTEDGRGHSTAAGHKRIRPSEKLLSSLRIDTLQLWVRFPPHLRQKHGVARIKARSVVVPVESVKNISEGSHGLRGERPASTTRVSRVTRKGTSVVVHDIPKRMLIVARQHRKQRIDLSERLSIGQWHLCADTATWQGGHQQATIPALRDGGALVNATRVSLIRLLLQGRLHGVVKVSLSIISVSTLSNHRRWGRRNLPTTPFATLCCSRQVDFVLTHRCSGHICGRSPGRSALNLVGAHASDISVT